MRDAGGQAADRGKPLLAPDPVFHLDHLGDVLERQDDAADRVRIVLEQRCGHAEERRRTVFFHDLSVEPVRALPEGLGMAEEFLDALSEYLLPAVLLFHPGGIP